MTDALAALRIADQWIKVLVAELDIEPSETVITVSATSADGKRELAKVNLAESQAQIAATLTTPEPTALYPGITKTLVVPEGFAILPIEPTSMMALRGYQVTNVFEDNDYFGDYIDAAELPKDLAPQHKFDDDERGWMLAAAAYRGCVAGYLETLRRLAKDPNDVVAHGWNEPIRKATVVSSTDRGVT